MIIQWRRCGNEWFYTQMRSAIIVNDYRGCLFLLTSLSWWNHTDLVRTKDVQVKWKVLPLYSGFFLQVQLQVQGTAMNGNQCNVLRRVAVRASESAVVKVTDYLLQRQQRSLGTDLLPCSLLRYHLLFSFCILLTRLLLHVAVFLLRQQR